MLSPAGHEQKTNAQDNQRQDNQCQDHEDQGNAGVSSDRAAISQCHRILDLLQCSCASMRCC